MDSADKHRSGPTSGEDPATDGAKPMTTSVEDNAGGMKPISSGTESRPLLIETSMHRRRPFTLLPHTTSGATLISSHPLPWYAAVHRATAAALPPAMHHILIGYGARKVCSRRYLGVTVINRRDWERQVRQWPLAPAEQRSSGIRNPTCMRGSYSNASCRG